MFRQIQIHRFVLLGFAMGAVTMSGCGEPTLQTEYVEGLVTLDGEPVPEATVTFVPVIEGEGKPANGRTNERGIYKLTAVGTGAEGAKTHGGTLPGDYYVGVIKSITDAPASEEEMAALGMEYGATPPGRPESPQMTHVVPTRYNNPRRSGLQVTVVEGNNNIPIELTSN